MEIILVTGCKGLKIMNEGPLLGLSSDSNHKLEIHRDIGSIYSLRSGWSLVYSWTTVPRHIVSRS